MTDSDRPRIPHRSTPEDWYQLVNRNEEVLRAGDPLAVTTAELDDLCAWLGTTRPQSPPEIMQMIWGYQIVEVPDWPDWLP